MSDAEIQWEGGRVKDPARAEEKAREDFGGDTSKIFDFVRDCIVYEREPNAYAGLELLAQKHALVRVKDRFKSRATGARPLLLANLAMDPEGVIVEVQLWSKQVEAVHDGEGRALRAAVAAIAEQAGREDRPLSADEKKRVVAAQDQLEALYGEALTTFRQEGA